MQKQKRERKCRQGLIASEMLANLLDQKMLGIPLSLLHSAAITNFFTRGLNPLRR